MVFLQDLKKNMFLFFLILDSLTGCDGMMGLEENEGTIDRAARIIVGLALAGAAYLKYVAYPLDLVFYLVGLVMLLTGVTGFCAIYKLLKISTK